MIVLIKVLLDALSNFFKWMGIEAEIRAKRIILDELVNTEDYINEIGKKIQELRKAGNDHADDESDARADRLRQQLEQRVLFSTQLSTYLPLFREKLEDSDQTGNLQTSKE